MQLLRIFLSLVLFVIAIYTGVVISTHGMGFLAVFFGDIAKLGWSGQFNLDFMFMLVLLALWVAWRHHFSPNGIVLAGMAMLGGTPFVCIYLLIESVRGGGNVREILVGSR
ncbi:hypothetical protein [Paracidovorax sp. MALMAid1276]|uniref:hypothetical protein n=1 Tax=Paracidovorax sp. MALMAid1276 TaxID=3411631 RepID=UPI003B99506A